jgi:hypothetical protein
MMDDSQNHKKTHVTIPIVERPASEPMTKKWITIPIVEQGSHRISGGFCSDLDVISREEEEALRHLKTLSTEALALKKRLNHTADPTERQTLIDRIETLRQEAKPWRTRKAQATHEKHLRLGHAKISPY